MHEKLTDILETKWLKKIENSLAAHGIETRREKDGDREWVFTCTCGQLTHDSSHGLVPALRSDNVLRRLPH